MTLPLSRSLSPLLKALDTALSVSYTFLDGQNQINEENNEIMGRVKTL